VNLLIGTENGLMLLDRSGQGKVYQLISRRRFQQMEVLEGQNILVTISGKKSRVRVYYLSWLKSKILRTDGVSDVGDHNTFITYICSSVLHDLHLPYRAFFESPTLVAKKSMQIVVHCTFGVKQIRK
jgi:hypothetical protein